MQVVLHTPLSDGAQEWRLDGVLHRDDGPAQIFVNGIKHWYKEGKLHRSNGPAVVHPDGSMIWFENGLPHRLLAPAYIPAVGLTGWFVRGESITYKVVRWCVAQGIGEDWWNWSESDKTHWSLTFQA